MMNEKPDLIPHLFRTEYSKIVAVLCKIFGLSNIQLAEDIVSETFLLATESWGIKGMPKFPKAWLYMVAKYKIKDYFKRDKIFRDKIKPQFESVNQNCEDPVEIDLSDDNIKDSQLKMLFAVCNPIISVESQIAMALKILCGFGIEEIANAFLTTKSTINKRLLRAKNKFRHEQIELILPQKGEIESRLNNILSILYLLYNEGYYSFSKEQPIRKEMCYEAMRLLHLLLNNEITNHPETNALMAIFCFHSSRFEARVNDLGEHITYAKQNIQKWNYELISMGEYFLNQSAKGGQLSKYHLEAAIAFWHTKHEDSKKKWESILQIYNQLLQIEYSPITALNRTFALSKAHNKQEAIKEALKVNLNNNHLYYSLLGHLYKDIDNEKELESWINALKYAKQKGEKLFIQKKIDSSKA